MKVRLLLPQPIRPQQSRSAASPPDVRKGSAFPGSPVSVRCGEAKPRRWEIRATTESQRLSAHQAA